MEPANLLLILAATASAMLIGYLWYSPWLFADSWMELVGLSENKLKKNSVWINYLITMVAAFLEALVLSVILRFVEVGDLTEGLKVGFLLWSGFVATTHLTNFLFAQKPLKLYIIDCGYHLVVILVMSAILTIWG